jgi:uncharacterized membrane protein
MNGQTLPTKIFHRVFTLGIWVKGFDAVLEMIGGFIFLLASNLSLNQAVIMLTQHELIEDPQDVIAIALRQAVAQITPDTRILGSIYLICHSLTKLLLVMGLLRGKRWAYPGAIGFLCLFIIYQLYRISYQPSPGLVFLTFFDSLFLISIWYEYQHFKIASGRAD